MQRSAILLLPFLVAGCALPPAFTVASFAADGISYLATGKTTTDHAISAVAQEDCAMFRALKDKAICIPGADSAAGVSGTKPSKEKYSHHRFFRLGDD